MFIKQPHNTLLKINDEPNSKPVNEVIFIFAKSGYGKGLVGERILQKYHEKGYVVIGVADPKDEIELGYAMFEPKEKYHLEELRSCGIEKGKKDVKLYHPFTFNLPTTKLPEMNLFTISLKEFGQQEWGIIAETQSETETIRLLKNSSQNISNDAGLYGFMQYLKNSVEGKSEGKKLKINPKNFFLAVKSGTAKSLTEISNYLQPFKKDYFLTSNNNPHRLNWKEILNDQKHYHIFTSNYIQDEKLKSLLVLHLLNQIVRNKAHTTKPIIIFIPEIAKLTPFKPEGYQKFLAIEIKEILKTIRSMGRGMSAVCDSQVYEGVDKDVRSSGQTTLFGELGSIDDIEGVSKALSYKRNIKELLSDMLYRNTYLMKGREGFGTFTILLPLHCHAEPHYNFQEMYKKHYPEKMKSYYDAIQFMKKEFASEETLIKNRVKEEQKREKEAKEKRERADEKASTKSEVIDKQKEEIKELKKKGSEEDWKKVYEYSQENPELGLRKIGEKFGISKDQVSRWKKKYESVLETIENTPKGIQDINDIESEF